MMNMQLSKERLQRLIRQAQGIEKADLVLKNCRVVNVFTRELISADIAVCDDRIAGIGHYEGEKELDCKDYYASPGFIEGHIHIESSLLSPEQFVHTVIGFGTTTVVCDPHEIANVAGSEGIRYILEQTERLPVTVFVMAPSCVPATHLETSGARLDAQGISTLYEHPRVIGLGEMMNYPGVVSGEDETLEKIIRAHASGLPVDGHAPLVSGKVLQAYIGAGIGSDHECTTQEEALEKLRAGMHVFIREGSAARNLADLLPLVTEHTVGRCLLVTDDCHPQELLYEGHLDRILRKAVRLGLDPLMAIQMVTVNAARYFFLSDRGALGPGYRADIVLFEDLHEIRPCRVFSAGRQVVPDGGVSVKQEKKTDRKYLEIFSSVHIRPEAIDFEILAEPKKLRVIKVVKDQILTETREIKASVKNGRAVADSNRDLAKIAVIERHHQTGNMGKGFVMGLGLRSGALASTIAHDSHNIVVVGMSDQEMNLAVESVAEIGGGLVVVEKDRILARMALDIAGLMSSSSLQVVNDQLLQLLQAAQTLGVHEKNPFMVMSFLALPVIPELKITDLGLIDVNAFNQIGIWV